LKSSIKSSSTTVSIGPVAVAEPPGADPLLTRMCRPPSWLCRLGDHAVHLLLAGDIGRERKDAPVRLGSNLPRRRLERLLVACHDRHIDPFARQFARDGFANAPTAAGHDRMFALQSKVHGIFSPRRYDRDFIASKLIVLAEGPWCKDSQTWGDPWNVPGCLRRICRRQRGA
jgi:hypothetical protein